MARATTGSTSEELVAEVACPKCDAPVDVVVPDRESEPKARSYVGAFGEPDVVDCPAGHTVWVYYC